MQYELDGIPEKVQKFMDAVPLDDELAFLRSVFLMYFYVYEGESTMAYNSTVFGVHRMEMIHFYGSFNIPYIVEE